MSRDALCWSARHLAQRLRSPGRKRGPRLPAPSTCRRCPARGCPGGSRLRSGLRRERSVTYRLYRPRARDREYRVLHILHEQVYRSATASRSSRQISHWQIHSRQSLPLCNIYLICLFAPREASATSEYTSLQLTASQSTVQSASTIKRDRLSVSHAALFRRKNSTKPQNQETGYPAPPRPCSTPDFPRRCPLPGRGWGPRGC